jgi:hypothetical protein
MTEEVKQRVEHPLSDGLAIVFCIGVVLLLPYLLLSGNLDKLVGRPDSINWLVAGGLVIGWFMAFNGAVRHWLNVRYRRKLTGNDLSEKVGDSIAGFWVGLIKWCFIGVGAIGLWKAYDEQFVPASSTNKLLVVITVLLIAVLYGLAHVVDLLNKKR